MLRQQVGVLGEERKKGKKEGREGKELNGRDAGPQVLYSGGMGGGNLKLRGMSHIGNPAWQRTGKRPVDRHHVQGITKRNHRNMLVGWREEPVYIFCFNLQLYQAQAFQICQ
jgi:hypothetical protein